MTIAEKQQQIIDDLSALNNGQDRLAHLVELSRGSPSLTASERREENRVPGCLAKLWLVQDFRDGRCHFACDSDSQVVKAVASLLCRFYSGQTPVEILLHDPGFLAPLGITQHLTPNRRNALARVWERIRQFAESCRNEIV